MLVTDFQQKILQESK